MCSKLRLIHLPYQEIYHKKDDVGFTGNLREEFPKDLSQNFLNSTI